VSAALFHFLAFDDLKGAAAIAEREGTSRWEIFDGVTISHCPIWLAIQDAAIEAWVDQFPGSRPPAWWQWSTSETRRIFGQFDQCRTGNGRCQPTGIPFGSPIDWRDAPLVESTPSFLDRTEGWLPGERDRVPFAEFAASPFSWDLCNAPKSRKGL
jgi:hypothetical protein